jgi:hypothetical protein
MESTEFGMIWPEDRHFLVTHEVRGRDFSYGRYLTSAPDFDYLSISKPSTCPTSDNECLC